MVTGKMSFGGHVLAFFYHAVMISFLVLSIPNVTSFFGSYETQAIPNGGVSIGGWLTIGDIRNSFAGVCIDLAVYITSIYAVRRYKVRGRILSIVPHAVIMFVFGVVSFIANYESIELGSASSAYSHATVGQWILQGPNIVIAALPPLFTVMMVILTPSIIEGEPVEAPEAIAARAEREEAEIDRRARLEAARIRASVDVEGQG